MRGKLRFKALREEQAALMAKFEENVLDATNRLRALCGRRNEACRTAFGFRRQRARRGCRRRRPGWKLTLHMPSYLPVMQYARDRDLRATMYRAYTTRASEFGPDKWNNGPLIIRLLELRDEEARAAGLQQLRRGFADAEDG
jgi:oligopeptidase A